VKLCALKVGGILVVGILGLPLGSLGKKNHLDVVIAERRKVYYKGEGRDFPQVRAVVSLMCPSSPWLVLTPKVLHLCTNYFALVLSKFV
jgi:predicted P-loop ATPase/GTPase